MRMHQISRLDPRGRFLCCVLSDDAEWHRCEASQLLEQIGEDVAWDFAAKHEALGMAAIALERSTPGAVPERWCVARRSIETRIQTYMTEMDRIAYALHKQGIPLVALKNSGIARGIYRNLGGCPMGDVDLLVRPRDFAQAHAVFVQNGFQLLGNQEVGRASLGHRIGATMSHVTSEALEADMLSGGREYSLPVPGQEPLWFELQCRSVGGKWIAKELEPPTDELVENSVPVAGTVVRLLDPVDNLLQVCLHTAKHTFVRAPGFRLHTDVDRIVRHTSIEWDAFCQKVEALRVVTAVYLSLAIPAYLLRTPVPENVLTRLNPWPRKHMLMLQWLQRVGWFNPKQKKWSKLGYIGFSLLLYDSWRGMWQALFPSYDWMKGRYGLQSRASLPLYHAHRIASLLFKRMKN